MSRSVVQVDVRRSGVGRQHRSGEQHRDVVRVAVRVDTDHNPA